MEHITVKDIVTAVSGTLLCGAEDRQIEHISIDSRTMKGNDLFVPLIGEKVDAHRFIGQAIETGAAAVLTSEQETGSGLDSSVSWIRVDDTLKALQRLGTWYRKRLGLPLVGVTGSVGKTTTREMIAAALSAGLRVYRTPGNSNSQVGVPITISEISESDQIGIIELGMSEPGEMAKIAQVACVGQAVMTNIGIAHIEQLGSQENICREKLHIQDGMEPGGILYLNGDDPILCTVKAKEGCKTLYYGTSADCDYRASGISYDAEGYPQFTVTRRETGEQVKVHLHVFGDHMILNAVAALAVAGENGVDLCAAAESLSEFSGMKGRQRIKIVDGITVIDDSYNASPVSMKAGIQVLCQVPATGKRVAVLADMKELGAHTEDYHREIGAFLKEHPVSQILLLGELAAKIGDRYEELALESGEAEEGHAEILRFAEKDALLNVLESILKPGDAVLFKGSNSMGLGSLARHFLKD